MGALVDRRPGLVSRATVPGKLLVSITPNAWCDSPSLVVRRTFKHTQDRATTQRTGIPRQGCQQRWARPVGPATYYSQTPLKLADAIMPPVILCRGVLLNIGMTGAIRNTTYNGHIARPGHRSH